MKLELWSPAQEQLKTMTGDWMAKHMGHDWRTFWNPQPEEYEVRTVLGWPEADGVCFLMTVRKTYDRLGFTAVGEAQMFGEHFVLMEKCLKQTLTEQLYRDAWGTALLDSGRELLREYIKESLITNRRFKDTNLTLGGPGLNGVPPEAMKNLYEALEGWRIGIAINDYCVLKPEKSCGGWFTNRAGETVRPCGASDSSDTGTIGCIPGAGCQFCGLKR